jgi:hypothetical protein
MFSGFGSCLFMFSLFLPLFGFQFGMHRYQNHQATLDQRRGKASGAVSTDSEQQSLPLVSLSLHPSVRSERSCDIVNAPG